MSDSVKFVGIGECSTQLFTDTILGSVMTPGGAGVVAKGHSGQNQN